MDIDYLIDYETEGTTLDFKATQYRKEQFFELLKDVMAMANATKEGERLIITGVKKQPDGSLTVNPIAPTEFADSAIYQQLVLDNIEPELHIDYVSHHYKGNQLIGVLKIPNGTDKPYMMKKAYGSDKQQRKLGESFIRKGTTTYPLTRKDIDWIFEQRRKEDAFNHQVSFYFPGTQRSKVLEVKTAQIKKLPSQRAAEKIKSIIAKKEEEERKLQEDIAQNKLLARLGYTSLTNFDYSTPFSPAPYENRSVDTLRENLKRVKKTYRDDDFFEIFEEQSEKINITILNEGSKYLEDAVIEVEIPIGSGYVVADRIYKEPSREPFPLPRVDTENINYPYYENRNEVHVFRQTIGNLRHLQPVEAFNVPFRITIGQVMIGKDIELKLTLFGRNLPIPIKETLILRVS